MPLADTSFLVDLIRGDHGAVKRYAAFEEKGIALFTTAITAMELYKGAYISGNSNNLIKVRTLLELFTTLPIDETTFIVFGRIAAALCTAGNPIGDFDEVVPAIALCNDGEIITRDRHFENIRGLTIIAY